MATDPLVLVGPAASRFELPPVPADTLVIHGETDDIVPLQATLDWARPQALPVVVLPGVGHFFHGQLTRLKQHPLDIVIVDPQYVPAMLFDDKADASDRIVSLIAAAADKAGVNRFRRWALMRHWHIHDNVPLERMIDPTDDARLHQSDWSTRRVSVALCEAISKAPAAVTQG